MKKSVKKIVALACSALVIGSCFAGCATNKKDDGKYKIGICQIEQHPALDAATDGFKKAVEDKLGKENVTFDMQNAAGDSNTCSTICNSFVNSGVDLIMANATPSLQAAKTATTEIPIVATSVTDFATALDISDWKGSTGKNVTGTADLAPLDEQAKMIKELFPNAKQVGLLYCSAEANSLYQIEVMKQNLDSLGIKHVEYTISDSNDVSAVVTKACSECDVLYVPTDNTLAKCAETVDGVARPAGVPIIAGEEGICKGCGVATLTINYYDIGYKAGEMAADILANGKDPATMNVEYSSNPVKKYDAERCAALGVTVPDTYEAIVKE